MSSFSTLVPTWDTSSIGDPAGISQMDRLMLTEHLIHCDVLRKPLRTVGTAISGIHRLLAERTLTGTLLMAIPVTLVWLAL